MPDSFKVAWSTDSSGQWHKILAFTRYDEQPWTASTACGRYISDTELGNESIMEPPAEGRCRKCDVVEIVRELARHRRNE